MKADEASVFASVKGWPGARRPRRYEVEVRFKEASA